MIPTQQSETVTQIYRWHETRDRGEPHHGRLGASIIGRPCGRFLWYSFRGLFKKEFPGRILRLFDTGHLEEPRFVEELRGIGCEVCDADEHTGKQFEFTAIGGHFVSHPDAVILGLPEAPETWHIAECKTMGGTETQKSKDFEKCQKDGVKKAKPEHYAQMMVGMGLAKLKRAFYLTKKKATDELYSERIRYVAAEFAQYMERAETIITSITPLERCASRPDTFACKWCDAYKLCWGTGKTSVPIPAVTCRSCCHATPELDGYARWTCANHGCDLTYEQQQQACGDHLLIPALVVFAEPVDSGPDWIEFKNVGDGAIWRHGKGADMWSTADLIKSEGPVAPRTPTPTQIVETPETCETEKLWEGEPTDANLNKAFLIVRKALGLASSAGIAPTREYSTDGFSVVEFGSVLFVEYTGQNRAAVWRGAGRADLEVDELDNDDPFTRDW